MKTMFHVTFGQPWKGTYTVQEYIANENVQAVSLLPVDSSTGQNLYQQRNIRKPVAFVVRPSTSIFMRRVTRRLPYAQAAENGY